MALYIALYDVHPGDRKHFERMLDRIHASRTDDTKTLYIESFGSLDALLKTPQKYDIFIIDTTTDDDGSNNIEIASSLREAGISAPIVGYLPQETVISASTLLLSKSVNDFSLIVKPVKDDILRKLLADAEAKKSARQPHIELRGHSETIFVVPDDIIYIKAEEALTTVTLKNNQQFTVLKSLPAFCIDLDGYNCFLQLNRSAVININHIVKKNHLSFSMDDGNTISYNILEAKGVSERYKKYLQRRATWKA